MDDATLMQQLRLLAGFLITAVQLFVGYLIVRLGYNLLVKGVTGEFRFKGEWFKGAKADLVSVSPGLLFALFGAAIILATIFAP